MPLAQVDWVFLVLSGVVLLLLVTWPAFKRLARQVNLGYAEGDMARSLDGALRLRRSWLPYAVLERMFSRGRFELIIAERNRQLGELDQAALWCEAGLRVCRKPGTRMLLHATAAFTQSERGRIDLVEEHLGALGKLTGRQPRPAPLDEVTGLTDESVAITCYLRAGRVRDALDRLREASARSSGTTSPGVSRAALWALLSAGHFDAVLRLTECLLGDRPAGAAWQTPVARTEKPSSGSGPKTGLGADQVKRASLDLQEMLVRFAGADAARHSGRWNLYERHLQPAMTQPAAWPIVEMMRLGRLAILAAHRGERASADDLIQSMESLAARYPRDKRLRNERVLLTATAWQTLGAHERVLEATAAADPAALNPLDGSELAGLAARSLAALGRYDEAGSRREEAGRLAPEAFWNRPPSEADPISEFIPDMPGASEDDAEPTSSARALGLPRLRGGTITSSAATGPIERMASGAACWAWGLAVFAFLPVAGALVAAALMVMAIILLVRARPLAHDRRTGWAALAISLLSLAFTGITTVHWLARMMPGVAAAPAGSVDAHDPPISTQPVDDGNEAVPAGVPSSEAEHPDVAVTAPAVPPKEAPASRPGHVHRTELDEDEPHDETEADTQTVTQVPSTPGGDPETEWDLSWRHHLIFLAVLVFSIILHEIGHALAALWSGDPTARDLGRISLSPLRHIDPMGSIIVPGVLMFMNATIIGWARPVPIRPDRFRNSFRGQLAVSLAGVSLNLMLALLAIRLLTATAIVLGWGYPGESVLNLFMPLQSDVSSEIPFSAGWALVLDVWIAGIFINAVLLVFNLLPVPPLDGYGVIRAVAPKPAAAVLGSVSGLATVGLLLLIAFNKLTVLLTPAIWLAMGLLGLAHGGLGE